MKVGFIGPGNGDDGLLREAVEFLIGDVEVGQAIYLGLDDALERVVREWAGEILPGELGEEAFLDRAAALACDGSADAIGDLLESDRSLRRLACIRRLPPPPARAIEMIGDRIVTMVHDKAILGEEDIANSTLLVYGKSKETLLKRFGPRYFLTPGPLSNRKVAVVEGDDEGQLIVGMFEPSGAPIWSEALQSRVTGKISVSS